MPAHPGRPLIPMTAPNGTWTADFKGNSRPATGSTVSADGGWAASSRCCSPARACCRPRSPDAPTCLRLFREYGLRDHPDRQRRAPSRRPRSAGSPRCPSGGFGWDPARVDRGTGVACAKLVATSACIEPSRPKPRARRWRLQASRSLQSDSSSRRDQRPRARKSRRPRLRDVDPSAPGELPDLGVLSSWNIRSFGLGRSVATAASPEALGLRHFSPVSLWDSKKSATASGTYALPRPTEARPLGRALPAVIEEHQGRFARKTLSPMSPD